jgi:hypothetical protein
MNAKKPIYSNSFKNFLSESDSRICNILHRLDLKDRPSSIVTTKDINYLTNRSDGTLSYLPSNREHIMNDDYTWSRKGRENGKPSRVIRKLFNDKFIQRYLKDVDFETFANLYKKEFNDNGFKFDLKPSTEIGNVYNMTPATGGAGLSGSCMRHCSSYMKMYEANSNMGILTLFNQSDELCGRALVWYNVQNNRGDKFTFMDRIYVSEDFMYEYFLDYARDNGWWRKSEYNSRADAESLVSPTGDHYNVEMTVHLDTDWDEYPYIDTFHYGGDGWISNSCSISYDYTYNDTEGSRDSSDRVWDELHQEYINDDDARYIEHGRFRNCYIHYENAVYIDGDYWWEDDDNVVNVNGTWYTKDDDDIVEIDGDWYRTDDDEVAYCECDCEYHLTDDLVYHDSRGWILPENAVKVKDVIYHKDEVEELV